MYIGDTTMVCKDCKIDKDKEPVVKSTGIRFIDSQHRMWNGRQCPECYKVYNRERMRLKRLQDKAKISN